MENRVRIGLFLEDIEAVPMVIDSEKALEIVITASEADTLYGLAEGTARMACYKGRIKRCRLARGTWLILREEADEMWGSRLEISDSSQN